MTIETCLWKVEEWKTNASLTFLNMVQMVILNGALVALALYCSYLVSEERVLSVGDFVLLGTYFMQVTPIVRKEDISNLLHAAHDSSQLHRHPLPHHPRELCQHGKHVWPDERGGDNDLWCLWHLPLILRWTCKTFLTANLTRRRAALQQLSSSPATSTIPIANLSSSKSFITRH